MLFSNTEFSISFVQHFINRMNAASIFPAIIFSHNCPNKWHRIFYVESFLGKNIYSSEKIAFIQLFVATRNAFCRWVWSKNANQITSFMLQFEAVDFCLGKMQCDICSVSQACNHIPVFHAADNNFCIFDCSQQFARRVILGCFFSQWFFPTLIQILDSQCRIQLLIWAQFVSLSTGE